MKYHAIFVECSFLLVLLFSVSSQNSSSTMEATFEELKQLNVSCGNTMISCMELRNSDDILSNGCSCGSYCTQLGICCVDSIYRNMADPKQKPTCRHVYHSNPYIREKFFVIDQCPISGITHSAVKSLCSGERSGEDDLLLNVPVTSLFTHITYKNYFCFRCHEANDEFLFWNVQVKSIENSDVEVDKNDVNVTYDRDVMAWMAQGREGNNTYSLEVSLNVQVPNEIRSIPKPCYLNNIISDCADSWTDDETRMKCSTYLFPIIIFNGLGEYLNYRNPHCALCHFKDLTDQFCPGYGKGSGEAAPKKPFSFSLLMDINRSDGDKVGKMKRCDDNEVWDPFFKKCRTLVCAIPGNVIKEGECGPP